MDGRRTAAPKVQAKGKVMGYVYFIQQVGKPETPIKIGYSSDPGRRISEVQIGSSEPLHFLCLFEGSIHDEARVHARFAHLRLQGEWFSPGSDLLDFINTNPGHYPGQATAPDPGQLQLQSETDARLQLHMDQLPMVTRLCFQLWPQLQHSDTTGSMIGDILFILLNTKWFMIGVPILILITIIEGLSC